MDRRTCLAFVVRDSFFPFHQEGNEGAPSLVKRNKSTITFQLDSLMLATYSDFVVAMHMMATLDPPHSCLGASAMALE